MMLLVVAVLWACAAPPPGGYALVAMTSDPYACHGLLLHARSYAHSLNHKALQHMGVTHILNVNTSHRFHSTPCEVKHVPMSDYGAYGQTPCGLAALEALLASKRGVCCVWGGGSERCWHACALLRSVLALCAVSTPGVSRMHRATSSP